jgi:hypothetical protein
VSPLRLLCVLGVPLMALAAGVRADSYQGVAPGKANEPPRAGAVRKADTALLTWPGFQMLPNGGSRVFLQVSKDPRFEVREETGRFVVLLESTRVHLRNNRRPLETRYFNTPVRRVRVERRDKKVAVVLELRGQAVPRVRTEPGPDGTFHFLYVEFPPGEWQARD